MIKKLFSLLALALVCLTAEAQMFQLGKPFDLKLDKFDKTSKSPVTRATAWEYFTYTKDSKNVNSFGVALKAETIDCAIFVPGSYEGKRIEEINFYITSSTVVSNVKAWVSTTLPSSASNAELCVDVTEPVGLYEEGINTVKLASPYTISAQGCYVGYTFTVTNATSELGQYPVIITDYGNGDEGGMYLKSPSTNGWINGKQYGNLPTILYITGDNYPENGASLPSTFKQVNTTSGNTEAYAVITVTNKGVNNIKSLSYTIKDVASGNVSEEKNIEIPSDIEFSFNGSMSLNIPMPAEQEYKKYVKEITITKVNNVANEISDATSTGNLFVVSSIVPRKVVEEEVTASGCPYCTRGIAGMEAMADMYPNNWIGIAIHGSVNWADPMVITDYNSVNLPTSLPGALLNRIYDVDPYFGSNGNMLGIANDVEELVNTYSEAQVTVNPIWKDESQNVITVNTDVKFVINNEEAPYALGYVLVADGLKGTSTNWMQYNGYYGATGAESEPYIYAWTKKGEYVVSARGYCVPQDEMVYDHVAIAAKNVDKGVTGSISAPLVAEQIQSHQVEFDLTNGIKSSTTKEELVQDKSKLKVVAMLINTQTGEIINADEKEIAAFGSSGINGTTTEATAATEVARYSIDGRKLSAPTKGINIIKMSDGTTRKVIVE